MSDNKTQATSADVMVFLEALPHPTRRADGLRLNALFLDITGWAPRMWGPSIVGYGQYHYTYDSGREGDFWATGFSPRKANLSIYVMHSTRHSLVFGAVPDNLKLGYSGHYEKASLKLV